MYTGRRSAGAALVWPPDGLLVNVRPTFLGVETRAGPHGLPLQDQAGLKAHVTLDRC